MRKIYIALLIAIVCGGCTSRRQADGEPLYVSILPLRSLVQGIVGDDFDIEVLVPPGASPETFEPTPRQFVGLNKARMVFNVGLIDFETTLLAKIEDQAKVVNLSRGIELIAGTCSHGSHGHTHTHGIDPHVWTSPRALQKMAENAYEAIREAYPDSVKYETNYRLLQQELKALDERTAARIAASDVEYFIIYHPALTYYARDYGLRQIAIEADGKEPSAKQLTQLIRQAREDGVRRILYQSQFPASAVEVIARDIDAEYYLMVDGDDTYPAEAAGDLIAPLAADEADMTVGDRISNGSYKAENGRRFHGFGNALVYRLIRVLYGHSFEDVLTGYRAFSRAFVKTMPVMSGGFQIETEISIWAVDRRWRVADVPIDYRDRPEGSESKLSTFFDGMLVLAAIASLFRDYRPMAFFGWLGLALAVVGLCFGLPVVAEYLGTGYVAKLPSAVLAVALMIVALSWTAGLILDTVAKSHRRQWEMSVYRVMEADAER